MSDVVGNGREAVMQEVKASAPLINRIGLHARPSVKLTQHAKRFSAVIEIATDGAGPWTDAKSPVKIMRVKAGHGETLHVKAYGVDAEAAVAALIDLINRKFDEE
jgi:phosphocarrier protein HPr